MMNKAQEFSRVYAVNASVISGALTIGLAALFTQLFMITCGLVVWLGRPRATRGGSHRHMILNSALLIIPTLVTLVLCHRYFTVWWDFQSTSSDDQERRGDHLLWATRVNNVLTSFSICIADVLLLYRCYLVFQDEIRVLVLPAITYLASLVVAILLIAGEVQWLALLGLSIAFNLMATALIAGRTIRARSRDSKIRGCSDTFSTDLQGDRSGLRSILVEAAVPLAICGMRTAVLQGLTSHYIGADAATQTRIMVAGIAASTLYTASVVFSPQVILLRFTPGRWSTAEVQRTWTSDESAADGMAEGGRDLAYADVESNSTSIAHSDIVDHAGNTNRTLSDASENDSDPKKGPSVSG